MADRQTIRKKVIDNIAVVSGFHATQIREPQSLDVDLGMAQDLRGALAPGFKKIAKATNPEAVITKAECRKLKSVKACVDLVHGRS